MYCVFQHTPSNRQQEKHKNGKKKERKTKDAMQLPHVRKTKANKATHRWLHGKERYDLQQVVLDDVTNDAVLIKVTPATVCTKVLTENDLHIADEVTAPQRLKDQIGKAQHSQVFDELLAQVVVDAVYLILCEKLAELVRQGLEGGAVAAKGLFDDDTTPSTAV